MRSWPQLFAVSLVVMGLSHTLTRERICEPLRRWAGGKETWLGYLLSCPYCASHWIAFAVVPLTGTQVIEVVPLPQPLGAILRWLFSSVLVAMLAAFFRVIFYFVDESQGLVRRRQKTADAEAEVTRAVQERIEAAADRAV